jgi:hypothetical protein
MRIAVLSDQHIDTDVAPQSWDLAKAVFEAVAAARVDHVVLAGDTFDCSSAMCRDSEKVRRFLKKLGLWHRDRLTILPGNHDIYHTALHGDWQHGVTEFLNTGDAQETYEAFCDWAGELASADDQLDSDDLFPMVKVLDHVRLWAVDTTASMFASSANGYWSAVDDSILRGDTEIRAERRVLAMHHPPYPDDEQKLTTTIFGGQLPFGFPSVEFNRLRRFIVDAGVDAVVCGHLHDPGDGEWAWEIARTRCPAFLMGRTGGMHDQAPCFGVLTVPKHGKTKWKTVTIPEAS